MAAKLGTNFSFHFRKLEKNVRCLIGIEEFRGGEHLTQTFTNCAFTGGNPSGDSDGRHSSEDYNQNWLQSGFILRVTDDLSNEPSVPVGRKNAHESVTEPACNTDFLTSSWAPTPWKRLVKLAEIALHRPEAAKTCV